jgi:hypothetical protein
MLSIIVPPDHTTTTPWSPVSIAAMHQIVNTNGDTLLMVTEAKAIDTAR